MKFNGSVFFFSGLRDTNSSCLIAQRHWTQICLRSSWRCDGSWAGNVLVDWSTFLKNWIIIIIMFVLTELVPLQASCWRRRPAETCWMFFSVVCRSESRWMKSCSRVCQLSCFLVFTLLFHFGRKVLVVFVSTWLQEVLKSNKITEKIRWANNLRPSGTPKASGHHEAISFHWID